MATVGDNNKIKIVQLSGGGSETWTRTLNTPLPGDVTFTGSLGSLLVVPSSTSLLPGDADSGLVVTESGGANGGDLVELKVDNIVVFSGEILAGGLSKVTTGDILDPIIYRPTPQTTAQLTALIPSAVIGDIAFDSTLGYHVKFDGTAWVQLSNNSTVIINDLTTGGTTDALSAEQGKTLQTTKVNKPTLLTDAGKILIVNATGTDVEYKDTNVVRRLTATETNLVPGYYEVDTTGGPFTLSLQQVIGKWHFLDPNFTLQANAVTIDNGVGQSFTDEAGVQQSSALVYNSPGYPFIITNTNGTNIYKVSSTQVPPSPKAFLPNGGWDAATNTPNLNTLTNRVNGNEYYVYNITNSGSIDLGSGATLYEVGGEITFYSTTSFRYDAPNSVLNFASAAEIETGTNTIKVLNSLESSSVFIKKSVANAKGDILVASANDTPTVLPVGINGQVLSADSLEVNGLKWIDYVTAAENVVYNRAGAFTLAMSANTKNSNQNIAQHLIADPKNFLLYNVLDTNLSETSLRTLFGIPTLTVQVRVLGTITAFTGATLIPTGFYSINLPTTTSIFFDTVGGSNEFGWTGDLFTGASTYELNKDASGVFLKAVDGAGESGVNVVSVGDSLAVLYHTNPTGTNQVKVDANGIELLFQDDKPLLLGDNTNISVSGTAGQVITSQGDSLPPVWADAQGGNGVYMGSSTTFAALPLTSAWKTTIASGDFAILRTKDGVNYPGVYRYNGTAFVFEGQNPVVTQTGIQVVGTFTPATPTVYDTLATISTGIDFTKCDLIEWTFRIVSDQRAITSFIPVVIGGSTPTMEVSGGQGQISSFISNLSNAAAGTLTNVDCHGVAFETISIRGLAHAENGFVIPTGTEVFTVRNITGTGITATVGRDNTARTIAITGITAGSEVTAVSVTGGATVIIKDSGRSGTAYIDVIPNGANVVVSNTQTIWNRTMTATNNTLAVNVNGVTSASVDATKDVSFSLSLPGGHTLLAPPTITNGTLLSWSSNGTGSISPNNAGNITIAATSTSVKAATWQRADAGVLVSCGSIALRMPTTGNRSLQISSTSGTISIQWNTWVSWDNAIPFATASINTASNTYLTTSYHFTTVGNLQFATIRDVTNSRTYKVEVQVGSSYLNNVFNIYEI